MGIPVAFAPSSLEESTLPLSKFLDSKFDSFPENFNVVHINAQSIPCHHKHLQASFDVKNLHAILVSETWLKRKPSPTTEYSLEGFHLIRNDRTAKKRGGGVGIYLRNHIEYKIVSQSPETSLDGCLKLSPEYLFLTVKSENNLNVLLGVYYSPSKEVNYFENLEGLLHQHVATVDHTIIMGDFNTCLMNKYLQARAKRLKNIMNRFSLSILPTNPTHHFPKKTSSLLDIMIVSSANHVDDHGQAPAKAFSHHDLVYLSYRVTFKKKILNKSSQRLTDYIKRPERDAAKSKYDIEKTNNKRRRRNTQKDFVVVNGSES